MTALSKFLVLLAIFLAASYANAFTCLSPVTGNQVWFNHLIQLQQPMSDSKDKPSCKPSCKPIKQINFGCRAFKQPFTKENLSSVQ
jgi:hypothetical protein